MVGESCNFRSRANRRELLKIYVQYNRFAGTGALGTSLSQTGWVQLQAALQEAQPWQQSLVGRACPLRGTGRSGTGNRGRLRLRGHQQSSVPGGRDNQLHPDKVAGAGLRCAGQCPLCQAGARLRQRGKKRPAGYQMLSGRGDWAYQAGRDVFTVDVKVGMGARFG